MSAPLGLRLGQRLLRPGHAHHVAEAGEDDVVLGGHRDPVVDASHRDHADRAPGAVDQLDVLGEQVVDAVLVDRVRVPAAHLHQLVVTAWLDRLEDLPGERAPDLGVAELVHVAHRHPATSLAAWAIAVPACTSSRSPSETGATKAISTVLRSPSSSVDAEGELALSVDADYPHPDRLIPTRDASRAWSHGDEASVIPGLSPQPGRSAELMPARHSITLAFSSSSSCS